MSGAPGKREVCFLLDAAGEVLWSDASASPVALPDSRGRWEAIWERRRVLAEVAHSHPVGPLRFSLEDETTMQALQDALGRGLAFSVVSPAGTLRRDAEGREARVEPEPPWASALRAASGMEPA